MSPNESKIYDPFNKYCAAKYDFEQLTSCLNGYYTINNNFCDVVFSNRGISNYAKNNYNACMDGYREGHTRIE